MKKILTEIGNASQFNEYLNAMGIHRPPLEQHQGKWAYKRDDELIALVERQQSGELRYYLNAHHLCRGH
ncbi:hypothetical protein G114_14821 [Aeromonas diversa CDC 2478-85]|uniref:Uncharacterized protein n=1 Tax=Aeromonas diversa CDC 2478-85 TaxID=1268237 RepID=N9VIE1_9GAMM|nr:hypothetical protein [Aeromonas diversa]ENY71151.1 hypothetical protein G114_14821 [Aeromonas diversa CDC 2478-85]